MVVEPYPVALTAESDVFPLFQHDGLEVLRMPRGEVAFRHADRFCVMEPGGSLFLDADAPRGPEKLRRPPVRFLSVISYARDDG